MRLTLVAKLGCALIGLGIVIRRKRRPQAILMASGSIDLGDAVESPRVIAVRRTVPERIPKLGEPHARLPPSVSP